MSNETPLKRRALGVMDAVEASSLHAGLKRAGALGERPWVTRAVSALLQAASDADAAAAERRVAQLRRERPDSTPEQLVDHIIDIMCRRTAAIGAASSGAAIIPAVGTLASLTVGLATDITLTLRLQAEMVLEIAAAYGFPVEAIDRRKLVLLVTGTSVGTSALAERAGQRVTTRISERFAQRWLAHALPILGVAASAGINVVSTWVIGGRARAYFRDGPEAVADWRSGLRALSGLDERRLGHAVTDAASRAVGAMGGGTRRLARLAASGSRRTRRVGGALLRSASSTVQGLTGRDT